MATLNSDKLKGLFSRVVNDKMEQTDKQDIVEYAKRVFGDGSTNPDPSSLHQFNDLVVQEAEILARPMVTDMLAIFAKQITANPTDQVMYNIPKKAKVKVRWTANGSGVDLVRVENEERIAATPRTFSAGFYYEPFGIVQDPIQGTRNVVTAVAEAKAELYLKEVNKLMDAAIASNEIPTGNVLSGSNLTLKQYNALASRLARFGGRPVFVADPLLVDYFKEQEVTTGYASEQAKENFLRTINATTIGRTDAVNLVNPFIDDNNDKVALPVNVGYMLASAGAEKPFTVVEYGGMKQMTEQNMEDERVKMKLTQRASIDLLFGELIAKVKEDAAVTL